MTTENLALFQAMGAKMAYLHQRQAVLSQNVANSDTPGYKPQDLVDVDFSRVLKNVITDKKRPTVKLEGTDQNHMPTPNEVRDPRAKKQKHTYEVAPVGNAVVLEEQLLKAGRTNMDYNLMSNLYQKNVNMLRTALGNQ